MDVNYVSACFDSSGYAEAARNYIGALDSVGIKVNPIPISFEAHKSDLGELGQSIQKMMANQNSDSKIQIIHATPENYPRFMRPGKYNIGYAAWETSKLPDQWVPLINRLNEIWVPCKHNERVFRDSGVKIPITVVPHTFRKESLVGGSEEVLPNRDRDSYMFYSVFQWTERKNPVDLLRAYLTEFKENEKVTLVLKSYFMNPDNPGESTQMKEMIANIKKRLYLPSFPKVLLISSLLSREQILSLHRTGDCYVSLHRCEGFGIPIVEAMAAGKPVIATSYGGPDDFGFDNVPDVSGSATGLAVGYQLTPCFGMPWPLYTGHMEWANPDVMEARRAMRYVFENRNSAAKIGANAANYVEENLSWERIGNMMKRRLEQISA